MKTGVGKPGFTIVELLIVVVIIAILAAITVVTFSGVQGRANDSRRLSDITAISKALTMYNVANGAFPVTAYTGSGSFGGWESSAHEASGEFLKALATAEYGLAKGVPVDPNNSITDSYYYLYYVYPAGNAGCDASRGAYYVLGIRKTAATGTSTHPNSPGFSCPTRNWQTEFSWVTGGFQR